MSESSSFCTTTNTCFFRAKALNRHMRNHILSLMRIASLVPSATEALFSLGLGDDVVAVTHECDWPPAALERPRLTRSEIPDGLTPSEIDAAVRELTAKRRGDLRARLGRARTARAGPDRDPGPLRRVRRLLRRRVLGRRDPAGRPRRALARSRDPRRGVGDLVRLGAECGVPERGEHLRSELECVSTPFGRRSRVRRGRASSRLEWLDPPFIGGHWVPEMIEAAGGTDALGDAGVKSRTATWEELRTAEADVAVVMPCGLYADEAAEQAAITRPSWRRSARRRSGPLMLPRRSRAQARAWSTASSSWRTVLHPDRAEAPPGLEFRRV